MKKAKKPHESTPTIIRAAFLATSHVHSHIGNGLGAIKKQHHEYLDPSIRADFVDSLDLDAAMKKDHGNAHRWDYLLGYQPTSAIIGLEPHSAKDDEISTVISKRKSAKEQLQFHLRSGARVAAWLWVASNRVHFADTEKARRRLDQNGIQFVGSKVLRKHLIAAIKQ